MRTAGLVSDCNVNVVEDKIRSNRFFVAIMHIVILLINSGQNTGAKHIKPKFRS